MSAEVVEGTIFKLQGSQQVYMQVKIDSGNNNTPVILILVLV